MSIVYISTKENLLKRTGKIVIVFILMGLVFTGCSQEYGKKPQLLIYCGITMIKPMRAIADILEQQENCEVIISKGGSGNLYKAIRNNRVGDLYLPGSDSYINKCKQDGLVIESVHVGYNMPALMVQKGNPKNLDNDLNNLTRSDLYVVMGNPESGSIGKITAKILKKKGIFDDVLKNTRELTTDSKNLAKALVDKRADLVINWFAVSTWPEYRPYITTISIAPEYAQKKKLILALLTISKEKKLARKFMALASSKQGREIFNRYGLYDIN